MVAGRALETSALTQNEKKKSQTLYAQSFLQSFLKTDFWQLIKKTVVTMYSETPIQMEINSGKHDLNQALTKYPDKISPHAQRRSWHE